MTKREVYDELSKFLINDMILINDEVIVENEDLNDDWFEFSEYDDDDDEIGEMYYFAKVDFLDIEKSTFKDSDNNIYYTDFKHPVGCVSRYIVKEVCDDIRM